MAHGSEASGGVALTGVGPVRQQQHPDGLQVDVVHLFVSGHLDAAGQGPRGAEHTGGWEGGGEGRGGEGWEQVQYACYALCKLNVITFSPPWSNGNG